MAVTLALTIICLLLCILHLKLNGLHSSYWEVRGVPFVKQVPLLGHAYNTLILKRPASFVLRDHYFQFDEPFFGFTLFGIPSLIIKCPKLIKNILVRDFNHFQNRHLIFEEKMDDFFSNMIFFMKHPKWKVFRSKTTPVFSSKNLKSMYPQMQAVTNKLIDFMNSKNKGSMETVNLFAKYTTQSALLVAFGVDSNSFQDDDTPFVSAGKNSFNMSIVTLIAVLCHRWKLRLGYIFKPQLVTSSLATFLKTAFIHILEERKSLNNYRGDFVDFLIKLKHENNLGNSEIVALATQFLVAGYESANTTISLALYELALNKCIQAKLREEVLSNLDADGNISYDSMNSMEYLDKIVHETLRKYPVFPAIGRTCTKNYRIPSSAVVIEKGVTVIISLSGMHHDPKYYPDPETFDPERFAAVNMRRRPPYTFLPFGEGQRSCIGQRLGVLLVKLGLAYVIKNYEVDVCDETVIPLQFSPKKINLFVEGGIYVRFTNIN